MDVCSLRIVAVQLITHAAYMIIHGIAGKWNLICPEKTTDIMVRYAITQYPISTQGQATSRSFFSNKTTETSAPTSSRL